MLPAKVSCACLALRATISCAAAWSACAAAWSAALCAPVLLSPSETLVAAISVRAADIAASYSALTPAIAAFNSSPVRWSKPNVASTTLRASATCSSVTPIVDACCSNAALISARKAGPCCLIRSASLLFSASTWLVRFALKASTLPANSSDSFSKRSTSSFVLSPKPNCSLISAKMVCSCSADGRVSPKRPPTNCSRCRSSFAAASTYRPSSSCPTSGPFERLKLDGG